MVATDMIKFVHQQCFMFPKNSVLVVVTGQPGKMLVRDGKACHLQQGKPERYTCSIFWDLELIAHLSWYLDRISWNINMPKGAWKITRF